MEATRKYHDSEAFSLMRAAAIIQKVIFQIQHKLKGSLLDVQYDTNPTSLLALVQMIVDGTDIENQTENNTEVRSGALSITQLLLFSAMKWFIKDSNAVRHNLDREIRLQLYLGLLIHNKTRKHKLIDVLFEKCLLVSYDRVLQLSTDMANGIIDDFEADGVVCPIILTERVFTTGYLDNLDHDPMSTLVLTPFHGTALSMTQHITDETPGTECHLDWASPNEISKSKLVKSLMESYTHVLPATFATDKPSPRRTAIPQTAKLESDEA